MRTLVIYYSRTGTTRKAARALADMLGADTAEIRCERYGVGGLGYIRAAYDSVRGTRPAIVIPTAVDSNYDLVVIAAPLWTTYPAVPARSFLADRKPFPGRVALLLTHLGSPPDKAFAMMEAHLGRPAEGKLALRQTDIKSESASAALQAFTEDLKHKRAA
jgi:hypothetical protein